MPFICHNCGEEWARHPAWVVPCPTCGAPAGSRCRRPSEHKVMGGDVHIAREQAAVDAGLWPKCPAGPSAQLAAGAPSPQLSFFQQQQ